MVAFSCHVCRTPLSAEDEQAGVLLRCPTCLTTLRVPPHSATPPAAEAPLSPRKKGAGGSAGRRYGFNCGYCGSRLEAIESMAGQDGQCPTCDNQITIPILDRYGRLIDPKTRQIIKQDPHPVHAYAAAGERAPAIVRVPDGGRVIRCPRCNGLSSIDANNCKSCGMPFTLEGTAIESPGATNGFCTAALVLGLISIPACFAILPSVLAVIFGVIGYNQVTRAGGKGSGKAMAITGVVCGAIGCALGFYYLLK